jgi:hypothetical protein
MTESSAKIFLGDTQPSVKLFSEHLAFTKNYFWQAESSAKIIYKMLSHRQKMLSMHSQHVSLQLANFFDIFCDG